MGLLRGAVPAAPARRALHEPHRQRLSRQAAPEPLAHQLLHHRLVPGLPLQCTLPVLCSDGCAQGRPGNKAHLGASRVCTQLLWVPLEALARADSLLAAHPSTPAAWLQVWPKDALEAVAYKFLKEMDLTDDVRGSLVELCQSVHRMVSGLSMWCVPRPPVLTSGLQCFETATWQIWCPVAAHVSNRMLLPSQACHEAECLQKNFSSRTASQATCHASSIKGYKRQGQHHPPAQLTSFTAALRLPPSADCASATNSTQLMVSADA